MNNLNLMLLRIFFLVCFTCSTILASAQACCTCPAGTEFQFINLDDVCVNGQVLFNDLDNSVDLMGTTFGGNDTDGGTLLIQIDFCPPINVCELELIGFETESIGQVGTTISGIPGPNQSASLGGASLVQCNASQFGVQTNPVTGALNYMQSGFLANGTQAGTNCNTQRTGIYTVSSPAGPISTLYFQYHNPPGGCTGDGFNFRIGACAPIPIAPVCPYDLYTLETSFGLKPILEDANGNFYIKDGGVPALGDFAFDAPPACGTLCLIEEDHILCAPPVPPTPVCPIDLVNDCPQLPDGNGCSTLRYYTPFTSPAACCFTTNGGIPQGDILFAFDGLDANGLPVHQNGITTNQVTTYKGLGIIDDNIPTAISANAPNSNEQAIQDAWLVLPKGLNCVDFQFGGPRDEAGAIFWGSSITSMSLVSEYNNGTDAFSAVVPCDATYICSGHAVIRIRIYYHDSGNRGNAELLWNIGNGFEAIDPCYINGISDPETDADMPTECKSVPGVAYYRDANDVFFDITPTGKIGDPTDDCLENPKLIHENIAIGDCIPTPVCPLDLVEITETEMKPGDGLLTSVWTTSAFAYQECGGANFNSACMEPWTVPFQGAADACGLPTHINGGANNGPFLYPRLGFNDVKAGLGPDFAEQAQQDGWLVVPCDLECVGFRLGGPREEGVAIFAGNNCGSMSLVGDHFDAGPDLDVAYCVPDDATEVVIDGCCFNLVRVRVYHHDPGMFSDSEIMINTGAGWHYPFINELFSVPTHDSDVIPTLGVVQNSKSYARYNDGVDDWYWDPISGKNFEIDLCACVEIGCVTAGGPICFTALDYCMDPIVALNCAPETPPGFSCPVDLVELELMCINNTDGFLTTYEWSGTESIDYDCNVAGGFRDFNAVDCTPAHENAPTQVFKANTLGLSDKRAYVQPGGGTVVFAADHFGVCGSNGGDGNPGQEGVDDICGEQGMQEGWIIFPKGVDHVTFRLGGPRWDASQLWLGSDPNSLALIGENIYDPGCSLNMSPSTYVTYSTCSLPTLCGGQPYAALKFYHHDPYSKSSTLVAWSTDGGKSYSGIPCNALTCVDPATLGCITTCATAYRDANGDLYKATAKDGVFRPYEVDHTVVGTIDTDCPIADCAPIAPVEICGDGIDNDFDLKIDEDCPPEVLACPVDLVQLTRLQAPRGDGMLTTQVWNDIDVDELLEPELTVYDFFGCNPPNPECLLFVGTVGVADNDPKSETGDVKMYNASGNIGADGNAEAAQQDGWLIVPCGVKCIDFRIGGTAREDVSALYLGPDVPNLELVGEWNNYGQQQNQVFHYLPGNCGACVASGSIGACTSTSTILRLRLLHFDYILESNTILEWNYGCGWEVIPSKYLSSVPVTTTPIPATADDPVNRLLVVGDDSNDGQPACQKTEVCDAIFRDANGNLFEKDGVTQRHLDPRFCETLGDVLEQNAQCFGICVIDRCDGLDNDGDGLIDEDADPLDNCDLDCEATLYLAEEYFPATSGTLLTTEFLNDPVSCCPTPSTQQAPWNIPFCLVDPCGLPMHINTNAVGSQAFYPTLGLAYPGDANNEQAQQDGWLIIPKDVSTICFRFGNAPTVDASAMYIGPDINNMNLLGEHLDIGADGSNYDFTWTKKDLNSVSCSLPCLGETIDFEVARVRFYHYDGGLFANTILFWDLGKGEGMVPVPAMNLHAATSVCDNTIPSLDCQVTDCRYVLQEEDTGDFFEYFTDHSLIHRTYLNCEDLCELPQEKPIAKNPISMHCIEKDYVPSEKTLVSVTCNPCTLDDCGTPETPMLFVNWYDAPVGGNLLKSEPQNASGCYTFDPVLEGGADPCILGSQRFYVECNCNLPCGVERTEVVFQVVECDKGPCDEGCTYFLTLIDKEADGWEAASLDVIINEGPVETYKLTPAQGAAEVFCLFLPAGSFIDFAYWNGADDNDNCFYLSDADCNIVYESGPNPPVDDGTRIKTECPECCEVEYSDFCARVTMGLWPEFMSWELYESTCAEGCEGGDQGPRVFGINATFYEGNPPGSIVDHELPNLVGCQGYTIALFDGFNTGWNGADWTLLTTEPCLGGPDNQILDQNDSKFGWFELTGVTDAEFPNDNFAGLPGDEYRECFQLPCCPDCPEAIVGTGDAATCTGSATILIPEAKICYPNCNHAIGCDIEVDLELLVDGNPDPNASIFFDLNAIPGTNIGNLNNLPVGCHKLVYYVTYCDGIITRCTSDITIATDLNPTMVCNDLVHVTLNNNDDNPAEGGWNQGFNDDLGECVMKITPDMILEATSSELCQTALNSEYTVTLLDGSGNLLQIVSDRGLPLDAFGREIPSALLNNPLVPATNLVSAAQAKTTITYVIEHKFSGNKCWGEIKVEDKDAPLIICNDYDIECTNPNYADENYSTTDTIEVGPELPGNIAGGFTGAAQSNLFLPVNVGVDKCYPLGVKLTDIQINLDIIHNEITDVAVFLHLPTALVNAGYTSPMTLDLNGDVGSQSTYTPNPVNDAPDLLEFVQGPLANPDCSLLVSTSPEDFATETTGAALPGNLGGTWYIQVIDNGVSFPDPPFGAGEVTAANMIITCGFPSPVAAYDCSPFELNLISEIVEETNCDQSDWNGAKLLRTYQAIDECGNASTCTQTVNLKAPSFDNISIPGDIDLECSDETSDPENITPELSGSPYFGCYDVTSELHAFCDVSYTYHDKVIPTCGKGYKIVREWTIVNCCTSVFKNFTQLIGVGDHTGPEINAGDITANSDAYDCDASLIFAQAVTDGCSGVSSISVSFTAGGGAYQGAGTLTITNIFPGGDTVDGLPLGVTEVMITATDSCNNVTTELVDVTIEDNSQPFAVCDDNLHVSLNNEGLAWITAEDFDEGSSDNCSEVTLEIRSLGCVGADWGPAAEVACCDAPNVTLELRVTDAAGNTNICWAEITVEDPMNPIVTCPADLTLDCNDPLFNDPWQDEPTATDNCAVELINTLDGGSLDNCHAGTLTRTWTYSDGSDKSDDVSCTQRITFEHISDFTVQFPPDVTINSCPDDTGDIGAPIILDDDCELVAINHEDQRLSLENNGDDEASCFKILRTWTLINWCVYDDTQTPTDGGIPLPLPNTFRDDDGYFKYVQEIKVIDEDAPTVEMEIPDPCDFTDGCEGFVELIAVGSDDCSTELEYNYVIFPFGDLTGATITGDGDDASGVYPYGCHTIEWHVGDHCGNWTTAEYEFCLEDCKNPTPVCLNGISVEVMNDGDGCVAIWATDLLEYAFDNCDEDEDIEASVLIRRVGDTGPPQTEVEVCCDDVAVGVVNVEIWVTDSAGNSDYCETYILAQDNLGNCPGTGGGSAAIAGDIVTEDYEDVDQVMVDINGTAAANGVTGQYNFPNLTVGNSYTVTPEKDIQPLNGVSTYDLVLISQHIIGTAPLTSPYQLIAADVNNSGSISTFDMVQLRQLILFVIPDFPSNTSWRFVDMDYVFPAPTNPWSDSFPELINVASLPANGELLADFFAIKIGDVNGSANPNTLLGTNDRELPSTLILNVDDVEMQAGETYTVDFIANEFTNINGYQFTLNFDRSAVEFVGTKGGALNVGEANFGTTLLDEGVLTTSYNEAAAMTVGNDETLFSITFTAKADVFLNDVLNINSKYTQAEAYNASGELKDVAIGFNTTNGTQIAGGSFELMQNRPNPFNESTVIGFNLPKATSATLKVYDVSGKMMKVIEGDFARGYNEVSIDRRELQATGVLYYQLDTDTDSATKKMILLD